MSSPPNPPEGGICNVLIINSFHLSRIKSIEYQWIAPLTPQRGEFRNTLIINRLQISRIRSL